jgi:hypothetical protein
VNTDEPRIRHAVDVLGELFPGAAVTTAHHRHHDSAARTFAVVPSARRARLLVPTEPRGAAASALRAYGGRLTRRARWSYGTAARALAIAGPALLRERLTVSSHGNSRSAGIDDHLSKVLGRQVSVAVHLTPSRANRKPIVQALAAGERHPLAFAKVAVDPLTSRLVEQETQALAILAGRSLTDLVVPTVAHRGDFAGHAVLTLHALPTWLPGQSPTISEVAAAAREVASLTEARRMPLQDSGFWKGVQQRANALLETPRAERLVQCVEQMTSQLGSADITLTASHGDWSPWNMWLTRQGLLVWDWERFERETPQGFDLLHFRLNDQFIRGGWSRAEAAHRLVAEAPEVLSLVAEAPEVLSLVAEAPEVLAHGGTTDPPPHTVLLYLVHLGLRYEADGQAAAGVALGHLETWLLPAIETGLADPALTKRT